MAVVKTILKKIHQEAVVKVAGTAATAIINLATDLLPMGSLVAGMGTITTSLATTDVVGVGTSFTADWVGADIFNSADVYVGTVSAYTSSTALTLSANSAAAIVGGAFKASFRTQVLDGAVQDVHILGVTWSGGTNGIVTITRGGAVVMTLQAGAAGMLFFEGQTMPPDSVNGTSNIEVAISGAQSECWLKLRKVSGFKTTVEPEQFAIYDNPIKAGS